MCGIVGVAGFEDKKLLNSMSKTLIHRGPDDKGIFIDKNLMLGHRRLSIIDLDNGKQPIHNENGDIWVVFNGEIYNYPELKDKLKNKHEFYTNTDTEVIVHAYEEYGEGFVNYLNGEFAIALWDSKKKKLILARDRLGVKPLYYYYSNGKLIFASEIKAILKYSGYNKEINRNALNSYLAFRCNLNEETFFKNIYRIEPGNLIIYQNNGIVKKRYWQLIMNPGKFSEDYCKKTLLSLLEDSVKKRMMTDVPLGAYLSGGIDSGTIVGLMSKFSENPINTFSVGFGIDKQVDELRYAKLISEYFGTNHHEIIVKLDMTKLLPKVISHFDEPIADPAAIPTYVLSERTKKKATVIQTGEGGDEVFAGYPQYQFMMLRNKMPSFSKNMVASVISKIPKKILDVGFPYASGLGNAGLERFKQFLSAKSEDKSYLNIVSIFNDRERKEILLKDFENIKFKIEKKQLLNSFLLRETKTTLPENLLMKVDKMTMANSIEARVPLLDYRIVDFATKIPQRLKLNLMTEKYILKQTVKPFMPREIIKRKKHHFFVPINDWFKKDLKDIAWSCLSKQKLNEHKLFNKNYLNKIKINFKNSELYYSRQLWNLMTFQMWYEEYMNG